MRRLLAFALGPLLLVAVAACGNQNEASSSATTAPGDQGAEETTSSTSVEPDTPGTGTEVGLEMPDGATMVAHLQTDDGREATIASDSAGACGLGILTPDKWGVNFSILPGVEDESNQRTLEGDETFGFSIDLVVEGGGSGSGTGEAGFSFDQESLSYEYNSEEADVTVEDNGDEVDFTFTATNEAGVDYSGEARCTAPVRNQ